MSLFPMFVRLENRKCVVVGAGKVGVAKAAGLLRNRARVAVIGPQATEWVRRQARAGKLTWHRREFVPGDVIGAFLVVAATDVNATNEAVFRACREHGVLCNVVDDPEHCCFYYPAVVRRGPLQIAISTAGCSPALAHRLRLQLQEQFGPEYGEWVEHVGQLRKQILAQQLPMREKRKVIEDISSQESWQQFVNKRKAGTGKRNQKGRRLRGPARKSRTF